MNGFLIILVYQSTCTCFLFCKNLIHTDLTLQLVHRLAEHYLGHPSELMRLQETKKRTDLCSQRQDQKLCITFNKITSKI